MSNTAEGEEILRRKSVWGTLLAAEILHPPFSTEQIRYRSCFLCTVKGGYL